MIEAGDGREAISLYRQSRPDAVVLDINMPVINGLEALKQIRHIDPQARVAMLSAFGQHQLVVQAIKAGARDFILKPFAPSRLEQAVRKLLEQAEYDRLDAEPQPTSPDKYGPHVWLHVGQQPLPARLPPLPPPTVRTLGTTNAVHRCPTGRPCTFRGCLLSR